VQVGDGGEKPGVGGDEITTPEVAFEEEQRGRVVKDEYLSAATEDPAWSLKASGSE